MAIDYMQTAGGQVINLCGQFLDALLSLYFLHHFLAVKNQKYRHVWIFTAIIMTVLTQVGDYLTQNNVWVWLFLLFSVPFVYSILFEQGKLQIKFFICEFFLVLLLALERVGISVIYLLGMAAEMSSSSFWVGYIFRRIILKLVLLVSVKFLLKHSIYENYQDLHQYWFILGAVTFFDFLVLHIFEWRAGETGMKEIFNLIVGIYCFLVPFLFYYVVYLMGTNLKRVRIGISQKIYIDTQEQYMSQILEMQDTLRKFKHDYKEHFFCIDQLLMEKNYEELHRYLETIHNIGKQIDFFRNYTEDKKLNLLLNQMAMFFEKQGINFTITVGEVSVEHIELCDLNMLLSNLCRNAAEAAVNTEEKQVELQLKNSRAYFQIMVQNSVTENPMRNNPNLLTDKEDKELHGLGMQIIRNVVDKYQGMIQIDGTDQQMKINVLLMDEA